MHTLIDPIAYQRALALRDLTDCAYGRHAMQDLIAAAVAALSESWGCPAIVHRASAIVSVADNYEALGYPAGAVTRDARYTRYVGDDALLRTHTSALIPGLLRSLALNPYDNVLLACPGLVYRRDVVDRLHVGEPHQLDLWRVCSKETNRADLLEMIELVITATLPGRAWRVNEVTHPYTTGGLEIEVADGARWVEVGECGLAARHVLERAGLDQHGLAMGLGLDRLLMLRKGIDDIRLLRSADPRVREQMEDLDPYRAVSSYPATKRDLSLAVSASATAEDLGDRVRALGEAADAVEEVELLAETDYADLPPQAVARIGIRVGQKNALVRLVLRHPTKTLSDEEANRLRDLVYGAVHEGDAYEWSR